MRTNQNTTGTSPNKPAPLPVPGFLADIVEQIQHRSYLATDPDSRGPLPCKQEVVGLSAVTGRLLARPNGQDAVARNGAALLEIDTPAYLDLLTLAHVAGCPELTDLICGGDVHDAVAQRLGVPRPAAKMALMHRLNGVSVGAPVVTYTVAASGATADDLQVAFDRLGEMLPALARHYESVHADPRMRDYALTTSAYVGLSAVAHVYRAIADRAVPVAFRYGLSLLVEVDRDSGVDVNDVVDDANAALASFHAPVPIIGPVCTALG